MAQKTGIDKTGRFQMNSAPLGSAAADTDYEHLPERVSRVIQMQQDASERLIGWS